MSSQPVDLPATELARERMQNWLHRSLAAALRARAMALPFPAHAKRRLLLVTRNDRIPQSQVFPFHFFADSLHDHYGIAVREVSWQRGLNGHRQLPRNATTVAFQTHYDMADADLERLVGRLKQCSPDARMVYLDWSAPTDLRNAARLDPHIDVYVKKHVLRDLPGYGQTTLGDTNLADHYARRLGVPEQEHRFTIPPAFLDKLVVGPSFVTAPLLLYVLMQPFTSGPERCIDLHARFATTGTPWYQAMRREAEVALDSVRDLQLAVGSNLPLYRFTAELRRSKVCFSPFGYGEVCWRDFEAVMAGAVLLKPDMSHVETRPDLFRAWETYVPLRWDLADFSTTLRRILQDDALRSSIAERAYAVLHDYLHSDAFALQMRPLFADATA